MAVELEFGAGHCHRRPAARFVGFAEFHAHALQPVMALHAIRLVLVQGNRLDQVIDGHTLFERLVDEIAVVERAVTREDKDPEELNEALDAAAIANAIYYPIPLHRQQVPDAIFARRTQYRQAVIDEQGPLRVETLVLPEV